MPRIDRKAFERGRIAMIVPFLDREAGFYLDRILSCCMEPNKS
jgi:hypothetical protein